MDAVGTGDWSRSLWANVWGRTSDSFFRFQKESYLARLVQANSHDLVCRHGYFHGLQHGRRLVRHYFNCARVVHFHWDAERQTNLRHGDFRFATLFACQAISATDRFQSVAAQDTITNF